ncbi:MAG: alpha-1,2-fucosyltransferase [bacterium]
MIITKLQGGLGNQMFQYAIGRFLAQKNKTELKLDLSFYCNKQNEPQRIYSLENFNIKENIATQKEIEDFEKYKNKSGWKHFFYKSFFTNDSIYVKEKQFNFDPKVLKTYDNSYLDGYWQNEKYFKSIENIIRENFTLKNKLPDNLQNILTKIKNPNSISLHIRRGDYVNKENYNVLPIEYYNEAIKIITEKNSDIHLFIFSDDIVWAKNNLNTEFPITFIYGNKDYQDLILMSLCKHNIIANSSFSWWGAWLNSNPNKIVIAPKKWFNKTEINTEDLIPKSWIKI